MEDILQVICIGLAVATFLLNTGRGFKAIEVCKECLIFLNNEVPEKEYKYFNLVNIVIHKTLFIAYSLVTDYTNTTKYGWKLLHFYRECGETAKEGNITLALANMCEHQFKYAEARELYNKAMKIMREIGDRNGEAYSSGKFGAMSYRLCEYDEAKSYLEKALGIKIEIGDRQGEATCYASLGIVSESLDEYDRAKEYLEKALAIRKEIGDRKGEATCYGNLGVVFQSVDEYYKAKECLQKALSVRIEIGDREGEAADYGNFGTVFKSLGEYGKAREYLEKSLAIRIEIGDRIGEASCYGNLGVVFQSLGEYGKAKEYLEKALAIRIEIGDRGGEAADYCNLGAVFKSLGEYGKAREYLEKSLAIRIETGDRGGEAADYGNLGAVFKSLGEYDKAKEYLDKALDIRIEIGDRRGEAADYGNLGAVFKSLGEYEQAKEYIERALAIRIEISDRKGEASCKGNLGIVFESIGEYGKANEYLEDSLAISIEIGDREGEATCYGNLGILFESLGEYDRAKGYLEKAVAIRKQIGDREGEAAEYGNLGIVLQSLGEYDKGKDYFERALSISRDIGDLEKEIESLCNLTQVELSQGKIQEALDYLLLSMDKSESLRGFLRDNDQFKISFSDVYDFSYQKLSLLYCSSGNPNNALYVQELARARALADLMTIQYSVTWEISANPMSWFGIANIMKKQSNCTCLYISYNSQFVFLWILKSSGVIHFRTIRVHENIAGAGSLGSLDEYFAKSFRGFDISSEGDCEDRSLNCMESELSSSQEEGLASLRLEEDVDERSENPESSLSLYHRMIIGPVADLLKEREIIIVPDRFLNQLPFAALIDKDGKYLSETFRIRIVPSLTTLKLIQDIPADYHYQNGALIVGDPDVGRVRYKGSKTKFSRLPFAVNEAAMIGRLLGVQPLVGEHATKQAVLERLPLVGLVHFAAHGDAERGEIALSPVRSTNRIPKEEDYLLTMPDIAQVELRAKLVVLSCCHSARGQIRAEGVIGIARAFLGSGARSVLVALWAISDSVTEQLMCRFYEHLVRGESASESLHQAMKWMRGNGFAKVRDWAPFVLIGDDVTFDFGKEEKYE
ncbi:tetratricopeptide repeat protein 28-like [Orbicella faveolata]|uniref:tetratricopeptide repeat protein 28-like n=1 Tax=Orbicella faveolata TaxID=48498 RepID=UPI0009E63C04|nr:tetratricopeptide repeat protein 28-like [Orbicella faveolata]